MTLPIIDSQALFDVRDKVAVVVGATGAFGRVACATLGGAGAKLVATAGNADALTALGVEIESAGIDAITVSRRPETAEDCDAIVAAAIDRFGALDILVICSGMNDVSPIVDMAPERFEAVMRANVDGGWLMARAAGARMIAQGKGGKVVFSSSARDKLGHRRIHRILHVQSRGRRHDAGVGMRMGQVRHHRECDRQRCSDPR